MSKARRVIAGVATVVVLSLVIELLVPPGSPLGHILTSTGLGIFVMFVVGGYVARSSFIIPALFFALAAWTGAVYFAWRIAAIVEGTALVDVAVDNLPGLVLYTVAAMAGAAFGMWLYAFRSSLWLLDH